MGREGSGVSTVGIGTSRPVIFLRNLLPPTPADRLRPSLRLELTLPSRSSSVLYVD